MDSCEKPNGGRMKGVCLCGGKGTRLGELTRVVNKHILPCGSLPMVYHPLKKMIEADITDIMVVSGTEHMGNFIELLGSGKKLGCDLTFKIQDEAGGIAQALSLARNFCGKDNCVVILGDNIFEDPLPKMNNNAMVMLKKVINPNRFGVASFSNGQLTKITEKPENPETNYAVTGIYFYPNDVFDVIAELKPSERGELEITDVNNYYINNNRMDWQELKGYWSDAGTFESLAKVNQHLLSYQGKNNDGRS